ncbi:MAG: LptF/LptG family permease [Schleiferiaceae bacterium]|jgi:lipopolysaccharide export system permease protein|nr:putative membrane protein [uncultured bacterium]|tara:strand:- start:2002 stop:3423 length:1422 start_codon:yes stop_codon:yes gene_type:complete
MNTLDRYVLKSFIRPLIPTLGIMVFFFLMQMVWKYVDDLAGKGIEWYIILELMTYWAASVVPFALPVSVLFASLLTFGNFGEHYEMAAMKSAGISLFRGIRSLIILNILIAFAAFFFYNNVIPMANLRGQSLLMNISKSKPAFHITPGIFYNGFDGYSIKIGEKSGEDSELLKDIYIYDHKEAKKGNHKVLTAASGIMRTVANDQYLEIELHDGATYEDIIKKERDDRKKMPWARSEFDTAYIRFSLGNFSSEDLYKTRKRDFMMLNTQQLKEKADTLSAQITERQANFEKNLHGKYKFNYIEISSADNQSALRDDLMQNLVIGMRVRASQNAVRLARSNLDYLRQMEREMEWRKEMHLRHWIEYYKKYALGVSVLIMFFIGAPLGSIIRKGGIGLPLVISTISFLVFHILNTTFEKMGREMLIDVTAAVWIPSIILAPIALWLTYSASTDTALLSGEWYSKLSTRFTRKPRS